MTRTPIQLRFGDVVRIRMPWSEVCMHMRVAEKIMLVKLIDTGNGYPMAQLLREDGSDFTAPILCGEAGIYRNSDGSCYTYPPFELVPAETEAA